MSRYCLFALSFKWSSTGNALSRGPPQPMSKIYRKWTLDRCRPSIETTLDQCHLFIGLSHNVEWSDPDIVCVIGQGRLSRPIMCLRCISAALRIFSPHMWLWCQMLLKPMNRFSKAIYIIAKYCIDIIKHLLWKKEHLLAFPSFKLSLWQFLKIILA